MKPITRIATFDGKEHRDALAAERHLDEEFGRRVSALGHKFAPAGVKYSEFHKLVEENLHVFAELLRIKADLKIEEED